ncbi:MAG: alpha/beta hydrolase, partial [Actinomycetota bacterium]|nr:alpha/beta hydrolase [Actinomycetota bacterium]
YVAVGHSFGGAVAVQLGVVLAELVVGVVTLATQSAGCEIADRLGGRPLLLVHGDADPILPVACSETVRALAGGGELVVLPGAGHLLTEAGAELRRLVPGWILSVVREGGQSS